jgi:hypothetical protein
MHKNVLTVTTPWLRANSSDILQQSILLWLASTYPIFFLRSRNQADFITSSMRASKKVHEASHMVAEGKAKTPRTVADALLMPVCKRTVKIIARLDAASAVSEVSLSADTISRPFSDMSRDMDVTLREKKSNRRRKFSLQIYESADISGHPQLIANIRYIDRNTVTSNFFSCKELHEWPGNAIFRVTDEYLRKHGLQNG